MVFAYVERRDCRVTWSLNHTANVVLLIRVAQMEIICLTFSPLKFKLEGWGKKIGEKML